MVLSSLIVVFIVLLILWQLFQRSMKGGSTGDVKLIVCLALIGGLLPWGALVAYLIAIRRWLPIWPAFLFNVVAWLVAFFVFAFSVASTDRVSKEDVGFRTLMPIIGIVVSLVLFGLIQYAGWQPAIPREQRRRAVRILVVFPTILALAVWYVGTILQYQLNRALGMGMATLIVVASPFVSAAILTTLIIAHYLREDSDRPDETLIASDMGSS